MTKLLYCVFSSSAAIAYRMGSPKPLRRLNLNFLRWLHNENSDPRQCNYHRFLILLNFLKVHLLAHSFRSEALKMVSIKTSLLILTIAVDSKELFLFPRYRSHLEIFTMLQLTTNNYFIFINLLKCILKTH